MGAPPFRIGALCLLASCATATLPPQTTANDARNEDPWLAGAPCAEEPKLSTEELVEGTGRPVEVGDTVRVHYAAALPNGSTIRESRASGAPIEIVVGSTKTFCGFDRALLGMRAGGKRRVLVPAALAFGEKGHGSDVPPSSDLMLTLEVFWPAESAAEHGLPPVNPNGRGGGRRR